MKKKHVIILVIILSIICIASFIVVRVISNTQAKLDQLANSEIQDVDLTSMPDGIYAGSYKVFPVSVLVEVTVENHIITEIVLVKHSNGQGASAEIIPDKVIEAQSLGVYVVSGATYSSKVILKAIESALHSVGK